MGIYEVEAKKMDTESESRLESDISNCIRLSLSQIGVRIFKNVAGLFYTRDGRPVKAGLMNGFSDLVGYKSVVITPDMVGQKLAVIVTLEVKTPTGRVKPEQQNFIDQVKKAGGIAGIVRSEQEAIELFAHQ